MVSAVEISPSTGPATRSAGTAAAIMRSPSRAPSRSPLLPRTVCPGRPEERCARAVFDQYDELVWHDWVPLGMRQRELELGVRRPTPAQLEHAKKVLADPDRRDQFPRERNYAHKAIQQLESPDTVCVMLQAVRIGDLGISAIPFEVFSEIGLELKARNPFKPSFTMELANGGYGYLPTPEQHKLGGYETWLGTSRVEERASIKIVDALLEMFAELRKGKNSR